MLNTKILTAEEFLVLEPTQLSSVQELAIKIVPAPEKKKDKTSKSLIRRSSKKEIHKKEVHKSTEFSATQIKLCIDNVDQLTPSLIDMIPKMSKLQFLDLSELYPSDQQWSFFYKTLSYCFSMNRLRLNNNKITDTTIAALLELLPLNLRYLELCGNNISNKQMFVDLFSSNSQNSSLRWSLKIIELEYNNFSKSAFDVYIPIMIKDLIEKNNEIAKEFKAHCLEHDSLNILCQKYQSVDVRVEYKENTWGSLLHYAICIENFDLFNNLLEKKISLNIRNFPDNQTAFEYAEFLLNQKYGKQPVKMKKDSGIVEDDKAKVLNKMIAVLCPDQTLPIESAVKISQAKVSDNTVQKANSTEKAEKAKRRKSLSVSNVSQTLFHIKPKEKTEDEGKHIPELKPCKNTSHSLSDTSVPSSPSHSEQMSISPNSTLNNVPK